MTQQFYGVYEDRNGCIFCIPNTRKSFHEFIHDLSIIKTNYVYM